MIIIGEKINGSIPSMGKAIAAKDEEYIRNMAKKQAEAGCDFIDVCASVPPEVEYDTLKWMLDLVQDAVDTPLSVDSPNPEVLVQMLPYVKRPGLINSVSMEGKKVDIVFPAIANTKWECVALLCDDTGIPQTAEKRLQVFDALMEKAKQYGIDPSRLHIDPLVEMLCTSEDGVNMVIEVIKEIKRRYPTIHVTGAVSNVSFNLPLRKIINQAFVVLAMNAGMDSAIFDPLDKMLLGMIYATEALLGKDDYCIEYITAYREERIGIPKK
jgi:5-methyltetrahydrofolate--homocysteine methyltransferase